MDRIQNASRLPAAERLARTLLGRIERGEYAPGEWLPTERELAAEFGANRANVRSALSSLAEKEWVVREPGRRPRVSVRPGAAPDDRAPADSETLLPTLAVVMPQPAHYPASPAVQRGALYVLKQKEAPYRLLVFDNEGENWDETLRLEREALDAIQRQRVAGVVLWHQGGAETLPYILRLQHAGVPVVLVDRRPPELACDFVGIDNAAAAWDAVSHLLDLGHRRVMHLTMHGAISAVRDREQGYFEAMLARGIPPKPGWVCRLSGTVLRRQAVEAADHFLSLPEPPTAVFVMQDALAYALMTEFAARGVQVPEQISVMGFDDVDRHSLLPSPLSTVHQPFVRMGQKAMDLLLGRLARPSLVAGAFQHVLLSAPLVLRSSCRPLTKE